MDQLINSLDTSDLMKQILEVRFVDVEMMETLCKQLLGIAESTSDLYGCAFANLYLLDYALTQGDYDSCQFYLLRTQPLCEEHGYNDLLLTLHNIAGMYYQNIFDQQSAMLHYLRGLELAKTQNAPVMESKLLNNIGICFSRRNDDASAAFYFKGAYEALEPYLSQLAPGDLGNAVSFLCNLAEAYFNMNRTGDSEKALLQAESLHVKVKFWELQLKHTWCGHYAMCGDSEGSITCARQLLSDGLEDFENNYLKISAAAEVCGYMLKINCQELALRYLRLLETYCGPDNLGDYYNCQILSTRYYQCFGTEDEQRKAYQKFYEVSVKVNETNHSMRVQAELTKIELTKALLDRQMMRRENRELEDASHMDELTWLYNRRYLSKLLIKVALEPKTTAMGYIMLDVDYFKQYNDFYGHFKGDDALRCVGRLLRKYAAAGAYPSRYGGDEFLVLCVNWSNQQMEDYIRQVQHELLEKKVPHEKSLCSTYLSLSVGCSNGTIKDGFIEQLLEQADQALYESKRQGRNRFVWATDNFLQKEKNDGRIDI